AFDAALAGGAVPVEEPAAAPRAAGHRLRHALLLGGVIGAIILIGIVARGTWFGKSTPAAAQSLAVLPLANLSRDSAQGYFADGMTDLLITHLARSPYLRVTSRTSTLRYGDGKKSIPEVGRELHVDLVVLGSLVREGLR